MVQYIKRIMIYLLGLFILALGVAVSINSNLGVSPVNSLPYVVSLVTGYDLGNCIIVIFSSYIIAQIVILRKEFKWINLAQVLCSTAFGYFTDFSKWLLQGFVLPTYAGKLVMLAISIVLVAAGVYLYLSVNLLNMPMEGLTGAISKKILPGKPFTEVKVLVDCIVVVIGIGLSLAFMGGLYGIREGTVLSALLVGKVMKVLKRTLDPMIEGFCMAKASVA